MSRPYTFENSKRGRTSRNDLRSRKPDSPALSYRHKARDSRRLRVIWIIRTELTAQMHGRMPVILFPNDHADWLERNANEPGNLLTPFPSSDMPAIPVNPIVNNARNERSECVEPLVAAKCSPISMQSIHPAPRSMLGLAQIRVRPVPQGVGHNKTPHRRR
jgi:hypothetical protein